MRMIFFNSTNFTTIVVALFIFCLLFPYFDSSKRCSEINLEIKIIIITITESWSVSTQHFYACSFIMWKECACYSYLYRFRDRAHDQILKLVNGIVDSSHNIVPTLRGGWRYHFDPSNSNHTPTAPWIPAARICTITPATTTTQPQPLSG